MSSHFNGNIVTILNNWGRKVIGKGGEEETGKKYVFSILNSIG
jgi:hypothetical protein